MRNNAISQSPYFDPVALRKELTALYRNSESPDACRPVVLKRLKQLTKDARKAARDQLLLDGDGIACAEGFSHFQDELIRLIFDYTKYHVYHQPTASSDDELMAIVATGGYGRGMLAPGSDIDLLFLLPYKQTPWVESVAEYILYLLWDLGFKVGHATRNIRHCVILSRDDFTIRTSLLDTRLILGDEELYNSLKIRFRENVVADTARGFITAKMAEREARHKQAGESRYRVEPNIKDGKGGLRDLHTLHWLIRYVTGHNVGAETVQSGTITSQEAATFKRCNAFLWTVRCHLHFEAGRAEERLSFDVQPIIAKSLKYREAKGLRAVERFMRHYFLVTKDVGKLTDIICSNLEIQQIVASQSIYRMLNPVQWARSSTIQGTKDFCLDEGYLNVADPGVFKNDPVNLLRIFQTAKQTGRPFHPQAIRLMRQSLRLINDKVRTNPEANQIFLELLCSKTGAENSLRRMNEAGVLGWFIPEFGLVVSMMQFNMYHHFTVDDHLMRTVGQLAAIENQELTAALPLSTQLVPLIKNRRALYVAAFLHDIAKGRPEDHSLIGAQIATDLCPRFGLSELENDTVCWLIREHLTMSDTALRRDLSDPKTIHDFAAVVQTKERLNLLLLLTVADIRAVGPGTWNSWKGQLLRELYNATKRAISRDHNPISTAVLQENSKYRLRERLAFVAPDLADTFIQRQYPDYWLRIDTDKQVQHAKLMRDMQKTGNKLGMSFASDPFKGITKLTILAPRHPILLALSAGCCAAAGADIIDAQMSSTRDGFALDSFLLQRSFEDTDDERRRAERIGDMILKSLKGEINLETMLQQRRMSEPRIHAFKVNPEVMISNALSDRFTVLDVAGRDRPGLLYDLTNEILDLKLDITSARTIVFGEKAIGVFYVTDLTNDKIVDAKRENTIRQRLQHVLQPEAERAA